MSLSPTLQINLRPILFSGPMVRAILQGRKTQTRRVVNDRSILLFLAAERLGETGWPPENASDQAYLTTLCQYGAGGDQLWVRETWRTRKEWDRLAPSQLPLGDARKDFLWCAEQYITYAVEDNQVNKLHGKLRPSIFMPRWASRITLEIVSVRVERLKDLSDADALAEGIEDHGRGLRVPAYANLWDDINAKRGFGWDANPWVWCIEFRRLP